MHTSLITLRPHNYYYATGSEKRANVKQKTNLVNASLIYLLNMEIVCMISINRLIPIFFVIDIETRKFTPKIGTVTFLYSTIAVVARWNGGVQKELLYSWLPCLLHGEQLACEREPDNERGAAVKKDRITIGHLSRKVSTWEEDGPFYALLYEIQLICLMLLCVLFYLLIFVFNSFPIDFLVDNSTHKNQLKQQSWPNYDT